MSTDGARMSNVNGVQMSIDGVWITDGVRMIKDEYGQCTDQFGWCMDVIYCGKYGVFRQKFTVLVKCERDQISSGSKWEREVFPG